MPVKNHRPSLTRTHSRSSSGGGSRLALNLQITQKDPVQPKVEKGAKRSTGHVYETGTRSTSKSNSTTRVRSAEHIANPPKRAPLPHAHRGQSGRPKAGFTLASPGSDEDEEWVSSESGAATPNHHTDDGSEDSVTTPQERHRPGNNFLEDVAEQPSTPRAEQPPQLRGGIANGNGSSKHNRTVSTSRVAPTPSIPALEPVPAQPADPERQPSTQPSGTSQHVSHLTETMPSVVPAASAEKNTTSGTTSPISGKHSRQHPHPPPVKRPPLSRAHSIAHSTHSSTSSKAEHAHPLRPHPLIRGQAIGHANLAPLSVTSDAAQAQLSASPSPPNTRRDARLSSSPTSTKTASAHPSPLHSSPTSVSSRTNYRRPSTSSVRSAACTPHSGPLRQGSRAGA
ncbi:hypothetical protein EWM64_g8238 [Hericium alpestre]|uniref:Uncharacterized protein n=1 Tax=Hericium alpestre TaxID=135208 RepID=A0A4Y9ZMC6_9AGAM|nr:hypothetical protein EWM64_g8238 [Hericium alpestre]